MKEYIKLLRKRNIALIFWGQWVSNVGSSINSIGLLWFIANFNNNISDIGLMMFTMILPSVIIGPFAGAFVDRVRKKNVVIGTDFLRGLLSVCLVFANNLTIIYAIIFVDQVMGVFFSPAIRALYPKVAKKDELLSLNTMGGASFRLSQLFAPALGGFLISLVDVRLIFILNGLSFIVSAISECFIDVKEDLSHVKEKKTHLIEDISEALKYINRKPLIMFVIAFFAMISITGGGWKILYTALINYELKLDARVLGFVISATGIGALIGAVSLNRLGHKVTELNLMIIGSIMSSLAYLLVGLTNQAIFIVVIFVVCGYFQSYLNISYGVYLQKHVDQDMMGRVFSLDLAIGNIFLLISSLMTASLGKVYKASRLLVVYACVTILIAGFAYLYKEKKKALIDQESMQV